MPTQEQINAANLELQIASDNYNRAQNKIDQYDRIFNSYMNMSDEKKRDPRIVSAMQNAIADYNNLKLERTTNMERMNNAQVALNEYNAQAVAQQQAATQRWWERRRVINPNPNPNPNNWFDTTWWINDYWTMVSPDWVTRIYPNWWVGFSEPRLYSELPYTPYTPANNSQNTTNFWPNFWPSFNNQPWSNVTYSGNVSTPSTASNKSTVVRDMKAGMSTVNWPHAGYITDINQQWPWTGWVAPVETQTVHAAKNGAYLRWMKDLEKMWYKVFTQKAYKDWKVYDLRSWKNI